MLRKVNKTRIFDGKVYILNTIENDELTAISVAVRFRELGHLTRIIKLPTEQKIEITMLPTKHKRIIKYFRYAIYVSKGNNNRIVPQNKFRHGDKAVVIRPFIWVIWTKDGSKEYHIPVGSIVTILTGVDRDNDFIKQVIASQIRLPNGKIIQNTIKPMSIGYINKLTIRKLQK